MADVRDVAEATVLAFIEAVQEHDRYGGAQPELSVLVERAATTTGTDLARLQAAVEERLRQFARAHGVHPPNR